MAIDSGRNCLFWPITGARLVGNEPLTRTIARMFVPSRLVRGGKASPSSGPACPTRTDQSWLCRRRRTPVWRRGADAPIARVPALGPGGTDCATLLKSLQFGFPAGILAV
jgi:hypothetical protein